MKLTEQTIAIVGLDWKCPSCETIRFVSYQGLIDIGNPLCGNCDVDMEPVYEGTAPVTAPAPVPSPACFTQQDFQTALDRFLALTNKKSNDNYAKNLPSLLNTEHQEEFFAKEPGSKFIKIVRGKNGKAKSVHCFIRIADGAIMKAASFNAPAQNFSRGNIFDENPRVEIYGD